MDFIVIFFRDILDGPLYVIVAFISGILFCSCIGYLAEQNNLKKVAKEKLNNSYATVANIDNSINSNVSTSATTTSVPTESSSITSSPMTFVSTSSSIGSISVNQSVNNGQDNNNISS